MDENMVDRSFESKVVGFTQRRTTSDGWMDGRKSEWMDGRRALHSKISYTRTLCSEKGVLDLSRIMFESHVFLLRILYSCLFFLMIIFLIHIFHEKNVFLSSIVFRQKSN